MVYFFFLIVNRFVQQIIGSPSHRTQPLCYFAFYQGLVRNPKVREKSGENEKEIKVREMTGNFKFGQGNSKCLQKSGKKS